MKTMKKVLVVVLAMAVACMCLVGCGSGDFEGKWECESMEMGGMKLEGSFLGVPVAVFMQIELKSGGDGVMHENENGKSTEEKFKWKADGKKCTIETDDKENKNIEFELKDGKLVAEYTENGQSAKVTLKKVDKFTEFTEEDAQNAANNLLGGDD